MAFNIGERVFLTAAEALEMLPPDDPVEVAENGIGFTAVEDMDRSLLTEFIKSDVLRELAGPQAESMGYRLVLWRETKPFFVKTKPLQ